MHPDGGAHAGSAVLIKRNIKHHETVHYCTEEIQATNVVIEDWAGPFTISAVYSPPKHKLKLEDYVRFLSTLGHKFIAGGDYNAKHHYWGSRTITTKGRQLLMAIEKLRLNVVSPGNPTYWPTDRNKIPDLLDFCITKGIPNNFLTSKTSTELSSDHSPVEITLRMKITLMPKPCKLYSNKTNWAFFRQLIAENLDLKIPLKTEDNISEAVEHFNSCVQQSAWLATPAATDSYYKQDCPISVRELLAEKRKARKKWQTTGYPTDKKHLNYLQTKLKTLLKENENQSIQTSLQKLDATAETNYSLWKVTKKLKRPACNQPPIRKSNSEWATSDAEKAATFAEHLQQVFVPNPDTGSTKIQDVKELLGQSHQLDPPITKLTQKEVKTAIKALDPNKAPGYDLITGKILRELPKEGIKFLTFLYNAILRRGMVPLQWKVAQVIMVAKPGKDPIEAQSYRPISLLPIPSKVMEIVILQRLLPIISTKKLIPDHQFGFRRKHGTIEQVHRLVEHINKAFESKQYSVAAFLDISQAFDRVWHDGLLFKIKKHLPINFYNLIKSYLSDRHFFVKQGDEITSLYAIQAGVPQGSVMGPMLYLLFTADLPTTDGVITGTFADDTAILSMDSSPDVAAQKLQTSLEKVSQWLKDWRIKANETKSVQVTFTNRKETCPSVTLNGIPLPQENYAKYLGIYLDRRLNWKKHILTKRLAMGQQLRTMHGLLNRKSRLSVQNKLLLYKCIIKPIWTYGLQLWGTSAVSNIEIIQRFQSKVLRMITSAPWYVSNNRLHHDLCIKSVAEEVSERTKAYKKRITNHPNKLAVNLMNTQTVTRRLKRKIPQDLIK